MIKICIALLEFKRADKPPLRSALI